MRNTGEETIPPPILRLILLCSLFLKNVSLMGDVLHRDRAVFRIEDDLFFASSLNGQIDALSKLHCLFQKKSFLLHTLDLWQFEQRVPIHRGSDLTGHRGLIEKLVLLNKIIRFLNIGVSLPAPLPSQSSCFKGPFKDWDTAQKRIYVLEHYLVERFGEGTPSTREIPSGELQDFIAPLKRGLRHQYYF